MRPPQEAALTPPQTRERIGRNFIWKSIAEGSKGLTALYFIVLARYLGTSELGQFSAGYSGAMILASLGDLGLNTLLTRHVSIDRSQGARLFLQTAYLKIIFFSFTFSVIGFWPSLGSQRAYLLMFLGIAASRNIVDQLSYLCLAHEKLIVEAQIKFALGISNLALSYFALKTAPSTLSAAAALLCAQALAAVLGLGLITRKVISMPPYSKWPPLGWPFAEIGELAAMGLMGVALAGFSRIDIAMLRWMGTPASQIGHYFAAERIIAATCLLPGFLAISALPVFSRPEDAGHSKTARRLRRELFVAGGMAAIFLFFTANHIITLIYGADFSGASQTLKCLALALPFMFMNHLSLITLVANRKTSSAAAAAFGGFALNVIINWTLIPRLGILGATIGAVSAQGLVSIIVWPLFLDSRRNS